MEIRLDIVVSSSVGRVRTPGRGLGHESPKSRTRVLMSTPYISIGSFEYKSCLIYMIKVRGLSVIASSLLSQKLEVGPTTKPTDWF